MVSTFSEDMGYHQEVIDVPGVQATPRVSDRESHTDFLSRRHTTMLDREFLSGGISQLKQKAAIQTRS